MPATALFEQTADDRFRPTELSRGPWDPNACHGGPPAALLGRALDDAVAAFAGDELGGEVGFFPARVTIELSRPVPLDELTVTTTLRRPGRRICIVDGSLAGPDGTVCLSGTLAAIRRQPFDRPAGPEVESIAPPSSGRRTRIDTGVDGVMFARDGVEHRMVVGGFEDPGPATDWIRLAHPVVEGREVSPLERVLAASDFGNGISGWFTMGDALFINPDLSVNLHRLPVGEWVCLEAVTHVGADGVGLAESRLSDEHGPIGRATQSLLVEGR